MPEQEKIKQLTHFTDRDLLEEMARRHSLPLYADNGFCWQADAHPMISGYPAFCVEFLFNDDGSLRLIGIWE